MNTTLQETARRYAKKFPTASAAAKALGVTPSYFCKITNGYDVEPSPQVLKKLGLRRVVSYASTKTAAVS